MRHGLVTHSTLPTTTFNNIRLSTDLKMHFKNLIIIKILLTGNVQVTNMTEMERHLINENSINYFIVFSYYKIMKPALLLG